MGMFVGPFVPTTIHDHSNDWYTLVVMSLVDGNGISSSPACFIVSLSGSFHHCPMYFKMEMNAFFNKEGTPSTAIDSVCGACPPPIAISFHTAAKPHSQ